MDEAFVYAVLGETYIKLRAMTDVAQRAEDEVKKLRDENEKLREQLGGRDEESQN